jgi:hypothetical protein
LKHILRALVFALMSILPIWMVDHLRMVGLSYREEWIQMGADLPWFVRKVVAFGPERTAPMTACVLGILALVDLRARRRGARKTEATVYPTHAELGAIALILASSVVCVHAQVYWNELLRGSAFHQLSGWELNRRVRVLEGKEQPTPPAPSR